MRSAEFHRFRRSRLEASVEMLLMEATCSPNLSDETDLLRSALRCTWSLTVYNPPNPIKPKNSTTDQLIRKRWMRKIPAAATKLNHAARVKE